jgi:hypothetical protein
MRARVDSQIIKRALNTSRVVAVPYLALPTATMGL